MSLQSLESLVRGLLSNQSEALTVLMAPGNQQPRHFAAANLHPHVRASTSLASFSRINTLCRLASSELEPYEYFGPLPVHDCTVSSRHRVIIIVVTPVKAALLQIFLAFHSYIPITRFAHAGETSRGRVVQETNTRTHQEQELSRAVQACFVCNSAKKIGIPYIPCLPAYYSGVHPLDYLARLPIYEDGAKLAQSLPEASLQETTTGSYRYRMNCRLNILWPNPVDIFRLAVG